MIIWPHGTEVTDEDPLTIDIPDLGSFTLGDTVELGGGFVAEHTSATPEVVLFEVAGVSLPEACAAYDIFLATPAG